MFDDFTSTQPLADRLKKLVHDAAPRKGRRAFMSTLQQFERCGWHSRAFDDASAGRLLINEEGKLKYQGDDILGDVGAILTRYMELVGCAAEEFPDPMNTEQAARYLRVGIDHIKKLVHRTGQLTPEMRGHTLMFSKAMLDEYNQNKRSVGRPKKVEE